MVNTFLTIVTPVFNEEKNLDGFIRELISFLNSLKKTYEVIIVDDGSSDGTPQVLTKLEREFRPHLKVIQHIHNKGNGAAVRSGIRAARGSIVACMDADGQHDPSDLGNMLPFMEEYDLVVGARPSKRNAEWFRTLANQFYNALASALTDFKVEDLTSGYRMFRTSVIRKYLPLFPSRYSYPTTSTLVMLKGGYNVKYVPINIQPRQSGKSKIKLFRDGWRFILIILKIIILFEPLRVFAPSSIALIILAIISAIYSTITTGALHVPNSSVILFVMAVVTFMIGLLAEQIAAIQVSLLDK